MPCLWTTLPDGTKVHINLGRQPRRRCGFCSLRWVTKLCDHPVEHGKRTCDAGMCDQCASHIGPDRDFCPPHARHAALHPAAEQKQLFPEGA